MPSAKKRNRPKPPRPPGRARGRASRRPSLDPGGGLDDVLRRAADRARAAGSGWADWLSALADRGGKSAGLVGDQGEGEAEAEAPAGPRKPR